MTGSTTMSNESRAIGRASTSGTPWTIWSPRDRRHRTAYAPSKSTVLIAFPPTRNTRPDEMEIRSRTRLEMKSDDPTERSRHASFFFFIFLRFSSVPLASLANHFAGSRFHDFAVCHLPFARSRYQEYIRRHFPIRRKTAGEFNLVPCQEFRGLC